jgi:hypothetical protein
MFALGTAETFADTASHTLLPMLVAKPDLGIANARLMAGFLTAKQLVGPSVGAFLFAAGMVTPFATQAVCGALGMLLVARIGSTGARCATWWTPTSVGTSSTAFAGCGGTRRCAPWPWSS